jgi:dolichol-phosphate mannosyltransferase
MLQLQHGILNPNVYLAAELAIVIPTFNERENISILLKRLEAALHELQWEAIFVDDDSTDGTVTRLEEACRGNPRLRCIRRLGRRGLSSAVVEGIQSTFAPYVAIMDADLQHDESLLAPMLEMLRRDEADVVVGSRYAKDGGFGEWDDKRQSISRIATRLSRIILKEHVLSDPLSGFFMVKQEVFNSAVRGLSLQGYKILLDFVASSSAALRIRELPYKFGNRIHGESKLDALAVLDYLLLLIDKLVGRWIPARFILFMAVGVSGIGLHMIILAGAVHVGVSFVVAQALATVTAMTGNFFLNNLLTYYDRRIRGCFQMLFGLATFYAVCSVGAVANVGIANFIFRQNYSWWLSGLCGILVGAAWNYAASSVVTWRK